MPELSDCDADHKVSERDLPIVVHEFPRNARGEIVRVEVDIFNGYPMCSIRAFYEAADGSWRPAKGGINLSVKKLETLLEGLTKAIAQARAFGWLDGGAG